MLLTTSRRELTIALLTALLVAAPLSQAAPEGRGGHRGPPPEAFEACSSKSENDACSFSGPRGSVEGTCMSPPRGEDGALACAPEGGPPDRPE
jgi:hypothetical protein